MSNRTATPPVRGGLRDAFVGLVAAAAGAAASRYFPGDPATAAAASEAGAQVGNLVAILLTGLAMGGLTMGRKAVKDRKFPLRPRKLRR